MIEGFIPLFMISEEFEWGTLHELSDEVELHGTLRVTAGQASGRRLLNHADTRVDAHVRRKLGKFFISCSDEISSACKIEVWWQLMQC